MSELSTWLRNTIGRDQWGIDSRTGMAIIHPAHKHIIAHYELEILKGHMSLVAAYERCCDDIQGRNHACTTGPEYKRHSKPQRGKTYRAVTLNILKGAGK